MSPYDPPTRISYFTPILNVFGHPTHTNVSISLSIFLTHHLSDPQRGLKQQWTGASCLRWVFCCWTVGVGYPYYKILYTGNAWFWSKEDNTFARSCPQPIDVLSYSELLPGILRNVRLQLSDTFPVTAWPSWKPPIRQVICCEQYCHWCDLFFQTPVTGGLDSAIRWRNHYLSNKCYHRMHWLSAG